MSMTERFDLEKAIKIVGLDIRAESADEGRDFDVACRMIVNALEEIQQYRAIGTVEEFKVLKESKCKYWNAEHKDCTLSYGEIRNKAIGEFAERMKELAVKWFDNGKMTIGSKKTRNELWAICGITQYIKKRGAWLCRLESNLMQIMDCLRLK